MLRYLANTLGILVTVGAALGLLARFVPPDFLWPPAIIALALPGLLLATLLYGLYLGLRRRWQRALFPAVVLLLSFPLFPRLFAVSVAQTPQATKTATILTTNVRGFRDDAYRPVPVEEQLGYIQRAGADALLMQESSRGRKAAASGEIIKRVSGLAQRHQPDRKALATFGGEIKFISDKFNDNSVNGIIVSDVSTPIGTLRIVNAHLQSNLISNIVDKMGDAGDAETDVDRTGSMLRNYGKAAAERAVQAERIRDIVRESPHPVIVGGDFNDVPSSYTYQRILSPRLRDAWAEAGFGLGTTFTGPIPGLRIDYLLVDTALNVQSIDIVETGFSDHYALKAVVYR